MMNVSMNALYYVASTTPFSALGGDVTNSVTSETTFFVPQWEGLNTAPKDVVCFVGSASPLEPEVRSIFGGWGWGWKGDCAVDNGCGTHILTGTGCTDADDIGEHWYNTETLDGADPWNVVGYRETDEEGYGKYASCVHTGFEDLMSNPHQIVGHAFVIHGEDGTPVSCGLISAAPADFVGPILFNTTTVPIPGLVGDALSGSTTKAVMSRLVLGGDGGESSSGSGSGSGSGSEDEEDAAMSAYTLNPEATGFVTVMTPVQESIPDSVCYLGYATGLSPNVESFLLDKGSRQCDTKNGCGTHIHEGPGCATKERQGSHYYDAVELAEDPWQREAYLSTNGKGDTVLIGCVITGSGAAGFADSRVFLLHDHFGDRILCGLLEGEGDSDDNDNGNNGGGDGSSTTMTSSNGGDSSSSDEEEVLPGSSDEEEGTTPSGSSSNSNSDAEEKEGFNSSSDELITHEDIGSFFSNREEVDDGSSPSSREECLTMEDTICSTEYAKIFSTMCTFLQQAKLEDVLATKTLTAFVPTNAAFEKYPPTATIINHRWTHFNDTMETNYLTAVSQGFLYELLSFHFIKDLILPTDQLGCSTRHQMANDQYSRTRCEGSPIPLSRFQKGKGNQDLTNLPQLLGGSQSNIGTCNGIIHPISQVMLSQK